jgi:8-oxo-dGTP pyrophosphatase MutT (NUDIX family)
MVINRNGHVLLVRHSYMPGWSLPGGGVDRGEPPDVAVVRELGEEIGLGGGVIEFSRLYTRHAGWATNVIALYRITGATVNFRPSREVREIYWADPANPPLAPPRARCGDLQNFAVVQFLHIGSNGLCDPNRRG